MSDTNPYEDLARQVKAQKLVGHLQARGIKSDDLKKMHPHVLRHHAQNAGILDPSDQTMNMVHGMLKLNETGQHQPEDPFEGLTSSYG